MSPNALLVLVYILGWILFVAAQAVNSVRSSANGLTGWAGFRKWLTLQAVNLLTRAFFSAILFGWVIQFVAEKIAAAGLSLHATAVAGFAGYAANALLYQAFGLMPWLRVEVQDLAPPTNTQKQATQIPPSETRS